MILITTANLNITCKQILFPKSYILMSDFSRKLSPLHRPIRCKPPIAFSRDQLWLTAESLYLVSDTRSQSTIIINFCFLPRCVGRCTLPFV